MKVSESKLLQGERRKDHYSHFILRLAFARSEDLRRRFSHAEGILFKLRFSKDDPSEKQAFIDNLGDLNFGWETVTDDEMRAMSDDLKAATEPKWVDVRGFFKVGWEKVHDLVEQRKVLVRAGKAYVPVSQQVSLLLAEFTSHLDRSLEVGISHPRPIFDC